MINPTISVAEKFFHFGLIFHLGVDSECACPERKNEEE